MTDNKRLMVGAGIALGLLYLSRRASAAEDVGADTAATDMAPAKIVALLRTARYQAMKIGNADINGILATAGLEDGDPSAYEWVKAEQSSGMTVIVSKDIKTAIAVGTVILSLSEKAANVFLEDATSYYKIPVLP